MCICIYIYIYNTAKQEVAYKHNSHEQVHGGCFSQKGCQFAPIPTTTLSQTVHNFMQHVYDYIYIYIYTYMCITCVYIYIYI